MTGVNTVFVRFTASTLAEIRARKAGGAVSSVPDVDNSSRHFDTTGVSINI